MQAQIILFFAGLLGASGVMLGAYAYHGLRRKLAAPEAHSFETGVKYQLYHALLLLFLSTDTPLLNPVIKIWAAVCTVIGILFFSGTVYWRNLCSCAGACRWLRLFAPLGGLLLTAAWLLLALSVFFS